MTYLFLNCRLFPNEVLWPNTSLEIIISAAEELVNSSEEGGDVDPKKLENLVDRIKWAL
jgi:hypothetical protein